MLSGERKVDCEDISARGTLGEYSAAMCFDDFFCDLQPERFCAACRVLGHQLNAGVENGLGYGLPDGVSVSRCSGSGIFAFVTVAETAEGG